MEHVAPINQPILLLISFLLQFYSGYEGVGKAISVCKQVLCCLLYLKYKYCIDTTSWLLYKDLMVALI